jgi:hypothetical protein
MPAIIGAFEPEPLELCFEALPPELRVPPFELRAFELCLPELDLPELPLRADELPLRDDELRLRDDAEDVPRLDALDLRVPLRDPPLDDLEALDPFEL